MMRPSRLFSASWMIFTVGETSGSGWSTRYDSSCGPLVTFEFAPLPPLEGMLAISRSAPQCPRGDVHYVDSRRGSQVKEHDAVPLFLFYYFLFSSSCLFIPYFYLPASPLPISPFPSFPSFPFCLSPVLFSLALPYGSLTLAWAF
jgi:hypothetical protein